MNGHAEIAHSGCAVSMQPELACLNAFRSLQFVFSI